jgi:hypothetical protein
MTPLDWALEWHSLGYAPIPTKGKRPLIKWKEDYGFHLKRPTEQQIIELFKDRHCNIGILTGKLHGVVVVDADSKEAVEYVRLTCCPTPMRIRSRRGMHFWYRHPGFAVTSRRGLDDPPVDVKGDGGICTGLGSVHESGFIYQLDEDADMVSVQSLPPYLKSWFPEAPVLPPKKVKIEGDRLERAARYLRAIPPPGNGARNVSTFKAAASLTHDFALNLDEATALLNEWNLSSDPPLPEREVESIVKSASKCGKQPIGAKL